MKKSTKNMLFAFILNLSFSIIEIVGGLLTNSIAIISDAVHDLGDSVSIGAALFLEKKSEGKPDNSYTYGYARFSLIGALITAFVLTIGSCFVIYGAVSRFMSPQEVRHDGMLILAILGVVVNGVAALKTSHGHSINEKTLSLHMLEDLFGWLAVLVGGLIIKFTGWSFVDPILSLCIAVFILSHAVGHIKEVFAVLLEKSPDNSKNSEIQNECMEVPGVLDVHHIHLWSLDGNTTLATLHALIDKNTDYEEIRHALHHKLEHLNIPHATIEFEYEKCEHAECAIEHHHDCGHHHH